MKRPTAVFGIVDDLTLSYEGNRLTAVHDDADRVTHESVARYAILLRRLLQYKLCGGVIKL